MIQKFIGKREKYALYSILVVGFLFGVAFTSNTQQLIFIFLALVFALLGAFLTQKENLSADNMLYVMLIPLHLVAGATLSLLYFPNLSIYIKSGAILFVGGLLYAVSLVNNIFLVVVDREDTIPLYRAAVTWSQIILVIVAIPYFTGIYKIPANVLVQTLAIIISTFLFSIYTLWILSFDSDVKLLSVGERVFSSLFVSFIVAVGGIATSFFYSEPFLRALFSASILMLGLGYIQAHFKNTITRKLVIEYFIIVIIFLFFVTVFTP